MQRIQTYLNWFSIVCLSGHFFCCVLPLGLNIINLIAVTGITAVNLEQFDFIHEYEVMLFAFSGLATIVSGISHYLSQRFDCHDTGCGHGPCEPKKKTSLKLFYFSLALFIFNVTFFFLVGHPSH